MTNEILCLNLYNINGILSLFISLIIKNSRTTETFPASHARARRKFFRAQFIAAGKISRWLRGHLRLLPLGRRFGRRSPKPRASAWTSGVVARWIAPVLSRHGEASNFYRAQAGDRAPWVARKSFWPTYSSLWMGQSPNSLGIIGGIDALLRA